MSLSGVDLLYYKQELGLKRPLFMHSIVSYHDLDEYTYAVEYCKRNLKRQLKQNKKMQEQIDYNTGDIVYKRTCIDKCVTYMDEPNIYKYALLIYKNIRQYNQCIIVNISRKYKSFYILLNHTFMDGVLMNNCVYSQIMPNWMPMLNVNKYKYIPFLSEVDSLRTLCYYATFARNDPFTHTPDKCPILHYLKIHNSETNRMKNICNSSFTIALLARVCEYIFRFTTKTSISVALLYGLTNPQKNNAYSFINVVIHKEQDILECIQNINCQIKQNLYQINGNYNLMHNMNINFESLYKQTICDMVFSSIVADSTSNASPFMYCHRQRTPLYVGCANTYAGTYASVTINLLSDSVLLENNEYIDPVLI